MGNWSAGQLERAKYGGAEHVLKVAVEIASLIYRTLLSALDL